MAVPDFQSVMLPLLQRAADGREHRLKTLIGELADELKLTEEDRNELIPSARQRRFVNRVSWAAIYLTRAGLLERTVRGVFRIAEAGRRLLEEKPTRIDIRLLDRYPEFRAFRKKRNERESDSGESTADTSEEAETPEELLERSFEELRAALADELLAKLKQGSPAFFERVVLDVMLALGYGKFRSDAGRLLGGPGDAGLDAVISEDKLGLESVALQAKRWEGTVGRPVVQNFSGSLDHVRTRKGVLVTTSSFTADAIDYVKRIGDKKIVLIDGRELAHLMIDHGVGVSDERSFIVKKIDSDYFDEG